MTEPLGRLSPDIPRWTTHEPEARRSTRAKPRVQAGIRFVGGAKAWCYLCGSEHLFVDPCFVRGGRKAVVEAPLSEGSIPCASCGSLFVPSPHGAKMYCKRECQDRAKAARRRSRRKEGAA